MTNKNHYVQSVFPFPVGFFLNRRWSDFSLRPNHLKCGISLSGFLSIFQTCAAAPLSPFCASLKSAEAVLPPLFLGRLTSRADSKLQQIFFFHARLQSAVAETLSNVTDEDLAEWALENRSERASRALPSRNPSCGSVWGFFFPSLADIRHVRSICAAQHRTESLLIGAD